MHHAWTGSRRFLLPLLIVAAGVLLLALLATVATAQTNPPASGNWDIYDDTTVSSRKVTITGSVLIHGNSGKLTLTNVDLVISTGLDGGAGLSVLSGAKLYMTGGSLSSANANHWKFVVASGSTVDMQRVTVTGMWQNGATVATSIVGGMQISSNSVTVTNCTFSVNDRVAITVLSCSPTIRGCTLEKSAYFTYYDASYGYLYRDAYGIVVQNGNPTIEGCTIREMGDYDTAFEDYASSGYGYTYLSLDGQGIFANGGAPTIRDCSFNDMGRLPDNGWYYVYVPGYGYRYYYFWNNNLRGCVHGLNTMMLDVSGCNFTGNYLGYVYGTSNAYAAVVEGPNGKGNVRDCVMYANGGGALYAGGKDVTFTDTLVMDFGYYGITVTGTGDCSVHDVILNGTAEARNPGQEIGLYISGASGTVTLYHINITFCSYGIQAQSTSLVTVRDSIIMNTTRKAYANGARLDLYNVSVLRNECELGWSRGEINIYFRLDFLVTWQNGLRIPGAVVQVFNDTDGLLVAVLSDAAGLVPPLTMLQTKLVGSQNSPMATVNDPIKASAYANGTLSDVYTFAFQNNTFFHLVVWDRSPPSVIVYSPKSNHAQNTTQLRMFGVAVDFGSGLLGVEVSTDGQSWMRADGWLTWNITVELAEGVYDVQVRGLDLGGGSSLTLIKNVTVDLTRPWLTITQPKGNNLYTNSTSITIIGQAEIGSRVFLNGDELATQGGQFFAQRSFSSEGLNAYEVMAMDLVGNRNVTILYVYQDITDPVLIIEHPPDSFVTNDRVLEVSGLTDPEVTITVNGILVPVEGGLFTLAMTLEEGTNVIVVEAVDLAKNHKSATLRVVYDVTPPRVTMTFPQGDTAVNRSSVVVAGTVDPDVNVVRVNQVLVPVKSGSFSKNFKLDEGTNLITIDVVDRAGNAVSRSFRVTLDTVPPELVVEAPLDASYSTSRQVEVVGRVEVGATMAIDGKAVEATGGYFRVPVQLEETPPGGAPNIIAVSARDAVGNEVTIALRVVCDTKAPGLVLHDTPPVVRQDFFNITGTVGDPSDLRQISVNGVPVEPNADGFFEVYVPLQLGNNTFTVLAVDRAGNSQTATMSIERAPLTVKEGGLMGLGDWSWLLLVLFLGVGLAVAFGVLYAVSRRGVRA